MPVRILAKFHLDILRMKFLVPLFLRSLNAQMSFTKKLEIIEASIAIKEEKR